MDALWQVEIELLIKIQALGPWLTAPMQFFSFLGTEGFFILIIPFIYWCIDPGMGLRISALMISSATINCYLKQFFHFPRPYWLTDRIKAFSSESTFGLPSGHAQLAASMWGITAVDIKRRFSGPKGIGWLALIVVFLIGFSRLYLGMHFISDVVTGWLIGFCLLWVFIQEEKKILAWYQNMPIILQILWTLFVSVLIIALNLIILTFSSSWQLPQVWIQNASAAVPGSSITPFSLSGSFTNAGIWLGMVTGATLLHHYGGFNPQGSGQARTLRFVIGLIGTLVLWLGLKIILPQNEDAVGLLLRYFRYTLVGAWVSFGAPMTFIKLNLAEPLHIGTFPKKNVGKSEI